MNLGVIRGNEASLEVLLNYRYPVTKNFEDCVLPCENSLRTPALPRRRLPKGEPVHACRQHSGTETS